jgi:hypothetical protein
MVLYRNWLPGNGLSARSKIRDVVGLNYAGIHLDRNFTTKLSLDEWMTVIAELQNEMTDAVIDESVKKMPLDIYNISGKEIAEKLKHRRDNLDEDAADYYRFISKEVNITGTTGKEVFEVTRIDEWLTRVVVYKTNAKGGKSLTIYQRTFLAAETKEIRLYGLEGDDRFDVIGNAKKGILIRIIGGKGVDSIADLSTTRGTHRKLSVYDDSKAGVRTKATNVYISSDSLKNDYNPRSFRFDWLMPTQNPGYNPDDGFYAGAGFIYKKQQFGKESFGQMHTLGANYAFRTGAYTFRYKGIFREVAGKWDLHIGAEVLAPNYIRNYYGLGNETIRREDVSKDYYRVRFDQITIGTSLQRVFGEKHTVSIGSDFQSVKVEKSNGRFISSIPSKLDSADFGRKNYTRLSLDYTFSSLDYNLYPRKGVRFNAGTQFIQSIKQTEDHFAQMYAEAAFYRSLGSFTLATRTGIATNIGDRYEFFQANTLGGMNYLRGFRRDRFAGKTAVYSNTELRFRANTVNAYIVKGAWGLLAFTDHGRVWMPGEESNEWHMGYGGGVWFLPFNRMALTATYGISKEDRLVNVRAGFFF